MRIIRLLGSITLWIAALLGLVAGGVWVANRTGYVQSMVVISGSMEPEIMTGDLLLDRYIPVEEVEVGTVLSLPSEHTGNLVTHRVISIEPLTSDAAAEAGIDLVDGPVWEIRMKGDANAEPDSEPYFAEAGSTVLTPWIQIPQGGKVVSKIMEPAVAMPVLLALIALLGLSLLDEEPRKKVRRVIRRVTFRDPRVDELDEELAAVGIDVAHLREMNELDLKLFALGIEFDETEPEHEPATTPAVNDRGFEDGLAGMEMPASDGLGLVPTPSITPGAPPPRSVDDATSEPGTRSPARSG